MNSDQNTIQPSGSTSEDRSNDSAPKAQSVSRSTASAILLAASVAAFLLAWVLLGVSHPLFEAEYQITGGGQPSAEEAQRASASQKVANSRNTIWALGLIGAAIGGLTAFGAAVARHSVSRSALGLLAVGVTGAVAGTAVGALLHPFSAWLRESGETDPMVISLVHETAGWTLLGLAIGLAVGFAVDRPSAMRFAAGAALGGLLAGLLCTPLTAFFLPLVGTDEIVPPDTVHRFLWLALPSIFIPMFCGIMGGAKHPRKQLVSSA